MRILLATLFVAVAGSWQPVGGQLIASGVMLVCGYQDIGMRARIGAVFWFFMALVFGISALANSIWAKVWGGVAICAVVLCLETWLIRRWWSRKTSA